MAKAKKPSATKWPKGFLWGVSTSSYQIEGAVNEDGRGPSIWDTRCQLGKVAYKHTGDVACDHYHRYPEDLKLMADLGVGAYRFSIAWPRVLPRGRGAVNEKGLDFYDRIIDACLEKGIEPWACLYHWDLPQALMDLGGWINRDMAGWFADYAAVCAKRYGDRVKNWATFNEFCVFTLFGYSVDWGAPGIVDKAAHLQAIHHVNLGHGKGVDVLRDLVPGASLGGVHNFTMVRPEKDTPEDQHATVIMDEHWNLAFPDPQILGHYPPNLAREIEPYVKAGDMAAICRPVDWFGLNHYGPIYCKADPAMTHGFGFGATPPDSPKTPGISWAIFPDVFRETLLRLDARYRLPVYVTENGCGNDAADCDKPDKKGKVNDAHRVTFLEHYTEAMAKAIKQGADVRGYMVWSLLDNFEWGSGYSQCFGLVHVDFETQKRSPKASYHWYKDLIRRGG